MVNPSNPILTISVERWPIAGSFTISRGAKTEAVVVVVELSDGTVRGRGECVPYARYGENPESIAAALEAMRPSITAGLTRDALQAAMPPGAARNALDCALWDLEAKKAKQPAWQLAGLPAPVPLTTAYTISLGTPESMAEAAEKAAHRPLLKVKLGGDGDSAQHDLVRAHSPLIRRSRILPTLHPPCPSLSRKGMERRAAGLLPCGADRRAPAAVVEAVAARDGETRTTWPTTTAIRTDRTRRDRATTG